MPSSALLDTVPRVGFYNHQGNPEDHMLPSVMRACMEYLGDDLGLPAFQTKRGGWQWSTCALVHGVTGSCFTFALSEHGEAASIGPRLMEQDGAAFPNRVMAAP